MPPLPKRKRFTLDDVLPGVLALVAMVVGMRIFGFFLAPHSTQVGFDEGYEAAGAERVLDGKGLPYVDTVSIRGPFLYWVLAIMQRVSGRFQWTGTRLTGLIACAVIVTTTFLSGSAAGWPLAGAVGAATYVFVVATYYEPGGGIGLHAEPVATAFISTAFCLIAHGLYRARSPRRRALLLALGGALLAMGGLTKQTLAICVGPVFLWILAHASHEVTVSSGDRASRWRSLLAGWVLPFLAGGAGLVLLVLLRYALAGELRTFFFWSVTVSSQIYMSPYKGHVVQGMVDWFIGEPWAILGAALAFAVAIPPAFGRARGPSPRGLLAGFGQSAFETVVGWMALLLMLAAAIPLRNWPHYFYPVWAFFGLVVGILVERVAVRNASRPGAAQAAVVLFFGALLILSGATRLDKLRRERAAGAWGDPRPDPICAEIDRIAGTGRDPIFIWGMAGDLYITCQRRAASMFTYTTLILGIMPPAWNEPNEARIPAGSREKLLAELTAQPPKVIIDNAISIAGTAMMDLPIYIGFVAERYCRLSLMTDRHGHNLRFYARKDLRACQQLSP